MATRVHFLGAGDAFSAGGRHQAGYLVQSASARFLLDCGATTLTAMKRDSIDIAAIDAVLLSHLHGDHFAGLPFLFLEYTYNQRRQRPLVIVGPPGTEERVGAVFRAMYKDLSQQPSVFPVQYIELTPSTPHTLGEVRIEPFRVPHQLNDVSLALRIHVDGKVILYSGDTGWTESLIDYARGTDLFICECCYYETRTEFHLDYPRLWENRTRFSTKRMILTHIGREVLARRAELTMEIAYDGLIVEV